MIRVMTQKGFTLIELLVALAIGGVITWGIVVTIHQVVWGTGRTNSQVVALNEVNRAALYIKKDLSTYNSVVLPATEPPGLITINWKDETFEPDEGTREHDATYSLSGTELLRIYDYDDTNPTPPQIISRHITYLSLTRNEVNGRFIDVVITATAGDMLPRSETLKFSVYQLKEVVPE